MVVLRSWWSAMLIVVALAAASIVAFPGSWEQVLRAAGWSLVFNDPLTPADIIVISQDSEGAGVLLAADLVAAGIATKVAIFTDPPTGEDLEFIRRGLPYEDVAARQVRQLKSLGIKDITEIPRDEAGSEGEAQVLARWCEQRQIRSLVFVAARDHSRRLHRIFNRAMKDHSTLVAVAAEHYSEFDPDIWWKTRTGIRKEIIEFEKLILDIVRHPLAF